MDIPDNIDGTYRACAGMQFVNQLDHAGFVRHRYEQAVEVGHLSNARNKRGQSISWHLHRNADRISSLRHE